MISALVSFGHFLAFFAISAALVVQLVLLSETMSMEHARRIHRASMVYLVSLLAVLIFGLLRVVYYEKGTEYYFGNVFFMLKLAVFILLVLLHLVPARRFYSWKKVVRRGDAPTLSSDERRRLRLVIHAELTAIGLIVLFATLMAHGIGRA